jgi:hypothetical protein
MSQKKKIVIALVVLFIIAVSNFPPIKTLIVMYERDLNYFSYSKKSDTSSFYFENGMGPSDFVYFQWKKDSNYIKEHPHAFDDTLYRNFKINPLFFWHWKDYFFDERYTLPYISEGEVYRNARSKKHIEKQ